MEELEKREKEANIAKLEAETKKLKADIAFNIAKIGLSTVAVITGLIIGLSKLMGP